MSGHNHRRGSGYRDRKFHVGQRCSGYIVFFGRGETPLSGKKISASSNCGDHTDGAKGVRKDRAGAKKFIHSRTRHHEDAALKRIAKDIMDGSQD